MENRTTIRIWIEQGAKETLCPVVVMTPNESKTGNLTPGDDTVLPLISYSSIMKRLIFSLATIAIFSYFISGCYYDNEEALYPELSSSCDTTNITFSGTIVPILSSNCYSCHSDANATAFGGSIHLEAIADVRTNSAKILVSINQTGAKPMPPSGQAESLFNKTD